MKKLVDVLKKWGVVIGAVLIAAMILGITAWADSEPDYSVRLESKHIEWIGDDYTNAKIELTATSNGHVEESYVPSVLFIGTMCDAHGMDGDGGTLISSINTLASVANVDYYLYNRQGFRSNDTNGSVSKGNSLSDNQKILIKKLNTNNHYALGKFLDCIYEHHNDKKYDYIILEFDGSLIADQYGVVPTKPYKWSNQVENVKTQHNLSDVANIMKGYYAADKVIWVCQDFNKPGESWPKKEPKVGTEDVNYYPTRYYSDHTNSSSKVWDELTNEQYDALMALICPEMYGKITNSVKDMVAKGLPNTRQTNYNNTEQLSTFLDNAIDSLYTYELTFTDKIKVADGCAYDPKNSYFMVKNAGGTYEKILSNSTQYPNTINFDPVTNTVTGSIKNLKGEQEVKLVIGLNLDSNADPSFKMVSQDGNPNDGPAKVIITPKGGTPSEPSTIEPTDRLNWPIEIKYEVEAAAARGGCKITDTSNPETKVVSTTEPGETAEEPTDRTGKLWTDSDEDVIVGSRAVESTTQHWQFVNWTHKVDGKDVEVSKELNFKPTRNSNGRFVADTYTANFKFLGSAKKELVGLENNKAVAGQTLTYKITLGNSSTLPCQYINVTDPISMECFDIASIEATDPEGNIVCLDEETGEAKWKDTVSPPEKELNPTIDKETGVVEWKNITVAAGGEEVLYIKVKLKDTITEATEVTNTVTTNFDDEAVLEPAATIDVDPTGVRLSYVVIGDATYGVPEEKDAPASVEQYYGSTFSIEPKFASSWKTSNGTKEGVPGEWVFIGWSSSEAYLDEVKGFIVLHEDKTLYGKWEFLDGKKPITVEKFWADGVEKHKDEKVEVGLYADGKLIDKQILSEENKWTYMWDLMPIESEEGKTITYSVEETVGIRGYTALVEETEDDYFVVTNKIVEKPKTGDSNNYIAFIIIGLLALVAIGVVVWTFTRRKK